MAFPWLYFPVFQFSVNSWQCSFFFYSLFNVDRLYSFQKTKELLAIIGYISDIIYYQYELFSSIFISFLIFWISLQITNGISL